MTCSLWSFSARTFVALGNYADLDSRNRYALDCMLSEMRQATQLIGFQKDGTNNWIALTNSALGGGATTYSWDASTRTLARRQTGQADKTYLTECDFWDFDLYQRTPQTNGTYMFFVATNTSASYDASLCKLVRMSWKCSRTILGSKVNTENVQTAQVVLRNKQ
ncbi:MAG: hypothetical protein DME25_03240 [Verrucomicrobia bacterium]|nr:MAG: hypothetical protein DME25_03240 [Verrucomicrobiota bacterium]